MARPARPWYRKSRGVWTVQIDGRQVSLGVTDPAAEIEAWAAYRAVKDAAPAGRSRTVAAVVSEYLADVAARVKPRTLRGYRWYLGWWVARQGTEPVHALTGEKVEAPAR